MMFRGIRHSTEKPEDGHDCFHLTWANFDLVGNLGHYFCRGQYLRAVEHQSSPKSSKEYLRTIAPQPCIAARFLMHTGHRTILTQVAFSSQEPTNPVSRVCE